MKEDGGSLRMSLLPAVLSAIAGSLDVIGLIELGLFTAHITGNLALLIAHVVRGEAARLAPMLSVPIFVAALGVTRTIVSGLRSIGLGLWRPLLLLELLLLAGCLAVSVGTGSRPDPDGAGTVLAGMLGVAAMSVQSTLVALRGAPATTVLTTNITRLTLDIWEILLARDGGEQGARDRARRTWPIVAGFAVGCGAGAACLAALGRWSVALPAGLALLALAMAPEASPHELVEVVKPLRP